MSSTIAPVPLLVWVSLLTAVAAVLLSLWTFLLLRRELTRLRNTADPAAGRDLDGTDTVATGSQLELRDEREIPQVFSGSKSPESSNATESLPVNEEKLRRMNFNKRAETE